MRGVCVRVSACLSGRQKKRRSAESKVGEKSDKEKWSKMDFCCGFRTLLFTYVLINGIFITLQTKEGERIFRLCSPKSFSSGCVGSVNGRAATGATRGPDVLGGKVRRQKHTLDRCCRQSLSVRGETFQLQRKLLLLKFNPLVEK